MTSGAVLRFAIVGDAGNPTIVRLEDALLANDIVDFHLLTNIVSLKPEGPQTFLRDCRHAPTVFSLTA